MASNSEPHFLRAIVPSLPTEIASKVRSLCTQPANELFLENFVRLIVGATCSSDASSQVQEQWSQKQEATRTLLLGLNPQPVEKRPRDEDDMSIDPNSIQTKRQKTSLDTNGSASESSKQLDLGAPLFTLHSVSTTSPIRKKVDISAHQRGIVFVNPSTKAREAEIPLSGLRRAFVVPTRGKSKPHWTVILLSNDVPDSPKAKATPGTTNPPSENQQIIFGLDANTAANFSTTSYAAGVASQQSHPKNSPTLPLIDMILSHLQIPVIRPSASTFKSACGGVLAGASASSDGIPGVEAYRGAKAGNLWFSEDGVLWGESKPCEFWAVEDLAGEEGIKVVGAGRSCTVVLARRIRAPEGIADGEEGMEDESEFGMIDGKERDVIMQWARKRRHLFGGNANGTVQDKGKGKEIAKPKGSYSGPMTIHTLPDESDEEDEEFEIGDSDSMRNSGSSGSSDESSEDGGSDPDGEENEAEDNDDAEEEEIEQDKLDAAHHPLMRPGAMPRMTRAARDMAIALVAGDLVGEDVDMGGEEDGDGEEEDELED